MFVATTAREDARGVTGANAEADAATSAKTTAKNFIVLPFNQEKKQLSEGKPIISTCPLKSILNSLPLNMRSDLRGLRLVKSR